MSDLELIDAVAHVTGETQHEIRRRGFVLTGPADSGADLDPECMLNLVDLPEKGMVAWDALGFGCREPCFTSDLKARGRKTTSPAPAGRRGRQNPPTRSTTGRQTGVTSRSAGKIHRKDSLSIVLGSRRGGPESALPALSQRAAAVRSAFRPT